MKNMISTNRLANLFPASLSQGVGGWLDNLLEEGLQTHPAWRAPVSVWEEEDSYAVEMDLPGVKQENLELTFENGQLRITAARTAPSEDRSNGYDERGYGKVTRLITLPESVESEAIEASLVEGVLRVTIPKSKEAKPKRIEIKTS